MTKTGQAGLIAFVAALALSQPALAQDSVTDFQLPPAPTPSASSSAHGPVDPDNPFGTRPTPRVTATPTTAPAQQPVIVVPPAPSATPPAQPSASVTAPRPRATTPAQPVPSQAPETSAAEPASSLAPVPSSDTAESEAPQPSDEARPVSAPEPEIATPEADGQPGWLMIVLGLLGLGLAGLIVWLIARRRRSRSAATEQFEAAPAPAPAPQPSAPAALAPAGRPAPALAQRHAAPTPSPALTSDFAPDSAPHAVSLAVEPVSLRVSLAYATLICRAAIANNTSAVVGPLAIRGDLASAHRAVDQRATLAPAITDLDPLATIENLAPGAAIEQRIEVKLPLSHVAGFVKGGHQFFVPLVRVALVPPTGEAQLRIWTVGTAGAAKLGPICGDTPRLFNDLAAIEIDIERWLALDPVRAAS